MLRIAGQTAGQNFCGHSWVALGCFRLKKIYFFCCQNFFSFLNYFFFNFFFSKATPDPSVSYIYNTTGIKKELHRKCKLFHDASFTLEIKPCGPVNIFLVIYSYSSFS